MGSNPTPQRAVVERNRRPISSAPTEARIPCSGVFEVGYTAGGGMIMGEARAVPIRLSLPNGTVTPAVWNALSIPGRTM